jgi:hypothetical protein
MFGHYLAMACAAVAINTHSSATFEALLQGQWAPCLWCPPSSLKGAALLNTILAFPVVEI